MGMPFYLLEMGEWKFAFGLAILLAAFGLLMIVPAQAAGLPGGEAQSMRRQDMV